MRVDLQKITSHGNDRLKFARRVRDGRADGKIFLEGVRLVAEAVRSHVVVESLFVSSEARAGVDDLVSLADARTVYEVSDSIFQSLCDTATGQGIIAIAERPSGGADEIERALEAAVVPTVVFLHMVNNPSNLGAVIRTAEAAGVAGVIVSAGSADAFSPKALRAAMGSSLRLPIWSGVEFEDAMTWANNLRLRTTAADVEASHSYSEIDWRKSRMLILGSEATGLDADQLKRTDELILIPMENKVESLNLAVACGVILFEARRQMRST